MTDMLRSTGKQSGESLESVLEKKKKATVGMICRKWRFSTWNERVRGLQCEHNTPHRTIGIHDAVVQCSSFRGMGVNTEGSGGP